MLWILVLCIALCSSSPGLASRQLVVQTKPGDDHKIKSADTPSKTQQKPSCPSWLSDYADFHKSMRGRPDATYLVFGHCTNTSGYNGIGDRMKTTMALLRLAAAHNKVLLIDWDWVAPLEAFLTPNRIDWRYDDKLRAELHQKKSPFDAWHLTFSKNPTFRELVSKGVGKEDFRAAKMVRAKTVIEVDMRIHGTDHSEISALSRADLGRCLFQFLFTPSKTLTAATDRVLTDIYNSTTLDYMAWHWRSGGMAGERVLNRPGTTRVEGTSRLHQLMAVTECAHDFVTQKQGLCPLNEVPLLLVTDHNLIRQWVLSGALAELVTPNFTAVHTRSLEHTYQDALNGWVDIALLARGKCFVMSHSGFSWIALWMSSSSCHVDMKGCINREAEKFRSYDVRRSRQLLMQSKHTQVIRKAQEVQSPPSRRLLMSSRRAQVIRKDA